MTQHTGHSEDMLVPVLHFCGAPRQRCDMQAGVALQNNTAVSYLNPRGL